MRERESFGVGLAAMIGADSLPSGYKPPVSEAGSLMNKGIQLMNDDLAKQLEQCASGAELRGQGGEGVWFGRGLAGHDTFRVAENFSIATAWAKPLVAIDTETGGLEPGKDALLSIAAVLEDGHWLHLRIMPPRQWWRMGRRQRVHPGAVRVNGYDAKKWRAAGAVELPEARLRFAAWLEDQCERLRVTGLQPLAHNAGFDRAFVDAFLGPQKKKGARRPLDRRWDCSCAGLSLARRAGLVECKDASLDSLCAVSHTQRDQPHDALSDARACLHGFRFLIQQTAKAALLADIHP